MAQEVVSLESLQNEWKEVFRKTLPSAATSKSPAQPKWPVHVDHCFARIILDSTVGIDTPWMSKVKSPAYKHMSREQLEASIELGRNILNGEADLVELDNKSLEVRGKGKKASGKASGKVEVVRPGKRKREGDDKDEQEVADVPEEKKTKVSPSSLSTSKHGHEELVKLAITDTAYSKSKQEPEDFTPYLKKIALCHKTPFQKKVLTALCQVPRGHYTTYAAISKHLSSSPRAVGNALKTNPFAPHVPCHRVLASGGGIGGFHGSWGRNGEAGLNDDKKRRLLREEGVKFDGMGKVVGGVWDGFR